MAHFLGYPKFTAFDSNGDPLNGGLLYTYAPGTTTNQATYPTVNDALLGTNANANPVVLDSRGEATVVISKPIKLVLKTSAGSTLWTVDNYKAPTDSPVTDANGNTIVGFNSTTSAVNYLTLTNNTTGNAPTMSVFGTDSNIGLVFQTKGSGQFAWIDGNAANLFKTATVSSAVNYLTLGNAATGNNAYILATGSDANQGINLRPLGTGTVNILGTASSAAELRLFEDTDNGTNYTGFKAAASQAASVTYTLPSADGTNTYVLSTDGAGTLSWVAQASTTFASAAEQETGTEAAKAVAPATQHRHASAAKAWVLYTSVSSTSISASYNVSSLTDAGTGITQVNFTTSFSTANYAYSAVGGSSSNTNMLAVNRVTLATGSIYLYFVNSSGVATDTDKCSAVFFGDQ